MLHKTNIEIEASCSALPDFSLGDYHFIYSLQYHKTSTYAELLLALPRWPWVLRQALICQQFNWDLTF